MNRRALIALLSVGLISTAGCGGGDDDGASRDGPAASPTEANTESSPTETATSPAANVLLQDDFATDTGAWFTINEGGRVAEVSDGRLSLSLQNPNDALFSAAEFDDAANKGTPALAVEADATVTSGAENLQLGVMCLVDADNYYTLVIGTSPEVGSGIAKVVNGGPFKTLTTANFNDLIKPGSETNHVEAACTTDDEKLPVTLTLSVNGQRLATVFDQKGFGSRGGVLFKAAGVQVITLQGGGGEVAFDNVTAEEIDMSTGGF